MRIPPSVIVMSLVTAVPFGFAVRASLRHQDGKIDEQARARAEAEQRARDYAEQEAQEARERDLAKARQRAGIEQLFGPTPATLGSLFHGMTLDQPKGSLVPEPVKTEAMMVDLHINIRYEPNGALTKVHLGAADRDLCSAITDRLDAIWHDGTPVDQAIVWLDPATHQRAVLLAVDSECSVDFTQYVPVEVWFDRSPASIVPVWAVGQPVERLQATLEGHGWKIDRDSLAWVSPGPGLGTDVTRLVAEIADHRVVSISAWSSTASTTAEEVASQLVKVLGPPMVGGTERTWATKPPVTMTFEDGVSIRVGRAPKDDAAGKIDP